MKKNAMLKGFTLVELIVVIAIIGVLAAILVPSMLGYVTKAKLSSINASAKNLCNAAMLACREEDVNHPIANGIYFKDNCDSALRTHIYEYFPKIVDCEWAIEIEGDNAVAACLQKKGAGYVGTYPTPNNDKNAFMDGSGNLNFAEALEAARPEETKG